MFKKSNTGSYIEDKNKHIYKTVVLWGIIDITIIVGIVLGFMKVL